ncbi:hypothetical protein ACFOMD_12575 [Sphingoaurantiacus capsulatus]|uniref:Uncharacterized protein n=1 Tax=Sphingoaurantiacus capsulatus TaxID=1771310 RepID=A0ABV7XDR8_9SPHN
MLRSVFLLLSLGLALPAQAEDRMDAYREKTRVVAKVSDCLKAAKPDEIVVCGRKQINLRYRLPSTGPKPGTASARTVGEERFTLQQYRAEGGSGSCTTVGPNGLMGCVMKEIREEQERGEPGLIRRVLTYLDPDE